MLTAAFNKWTTAKFGFAILRDRIVECDKSGSTRFTDMYDPLSGKSCVLHITLSRICSDELECVLGWSMQMSTGSLVPSEHNRYPVPYAEVPQTTFFVCDVSHQVSALPRALACLAASIDSLIDVTFEV